MIILSSTSHEIKIEIFWKWISVHIVQVDNCLRVNASSEFLITNSHADNWPKGMVYSFIKYFCHTQTSQVTYVTMVPRMGNETLRPIGVAMGNALSVTRVWRYICKNTTCWPATAHDVTTGVPQYKCRRENTSSASSSEACVRSMAQSLGDAVSRSPFGEPWLHM